MLADEIKQESQQSKTSGNSDFQSVDDFLQSVRKVSPPSESRLHNYAEPRNFSPMRISTSYGTRSYDAFQDPIEGARPKTTIHPSRKSRMAFVSAFEYNSNDSYSVPSWVTPRKVDDMLGSVPRKKMISLADQDCSASDKTSYDCELMPHVLNSQH